jgi:hypothetical protein
MDFAWVAIVALGLIASDVNAARALTFCDIYPNRCQYTRQGLLLSARLPPAE